MTTESKPKKRPASKASASKKEAEKTNSKQEKAVKALRVAKDRVEKAAVDAKKKVKAVKEQIDTEENRTKVKAAARLSRMKAGKAKDKAETLLQKAKAKAEEVAGQMEKAAKGHPKAEAALKQAKKAKAKVEAAGEKLKSVKETVAEQGKKARKATKEAVGKTKSTVDKAVKTAKKFKDTVDTPENRAKVKDAAYSIGSSLKEAVSDVVKEVAKSRTASKAKSKTGKSAAAKPAKPKATKPVSKAAPAKAAAKTTKASATKAKPKATKATAKSTAAKPAQGGRAEEDVTELTAKELGLSFDEYGRICQLLGRNPNFTELSFYARIWSEEVSYKNSFKWLRAFPAGEDSLRPQETASDAHGVDLGNGAACVLKVEAGLSASEEESEKEILSRLDMTLMAEGARPVLSSVLQSEGLESETNRVFCRFEGDSYRNNTGFNGRKTLSVQEQKGLPLRDFLSVGVVPASFRLEKETPGKGDSFYLIVLPEGLSRAEQWQMSRSLLEDKAVLALTAIGRSGLVGALVRLCGQAGIGARIDCSHDWMEGKEVWESMTSRIPGCYLAAVRRKEGAPGLKVSKAAVYPIGEAISENRLQCLEQEKVRVDIPVSSLVVGQGTPVYDLKYKEAKNFAQCKRFDIHTVKDIDLEEAVEVARFLAKETGSVFGISEAFRAGSENAEESMVLTMGGNAAYLFANPLAGAQIAVAEAGRILVCTGANPRCIASCLHFGTPQNPEAYWQFVSAVKGLKTVCESLRLPVAGLDSRFAKPADSKLDTGNPAMVVGMIGSLDSGKRLSRSFAQKGHAIYLLGKCVEDINSSRYLSAYRKQAYSPAPYFNLEEEYKLQRVLLDAIDSHLLESACPVTEGGLFMALIESAKLNNLGFDIMVDDSFRLDSYLFGESQGRVVVTIDAAVDTEFKDLMMETKTPMVCLGEVTGGEILVDDCDFGKIEDYK